MLMHFIRRMAVWGAILILPFLLAGLALSLGFSRSIGDPQPLKDTLKESGVYGSAVDTLLEVTDNPNKQGEGIAVDNPIVREALKKAFPPQLLQSSTENFIDGTHAWLEGETTTPQFRIDLTEAKETLVSEIAAGAQVRAASLPPCPRGQTQFDDPLNATCLPRGASPALAAERIRAELTGPDAKILQNPVITPDTIKNNQGQSAFSSDSGAPENYQRLKKTPLVFGILAALALLAIIFLSDNRAKGLKRAGITLLIVGALTVLGAWGSGRIFTEALLPNMKLQSPALESNVRTILADLSTHVSRNFMTIGGVYAALGAAAIASSVYLGRRTGLASVSATKKGSPAAAKRK